MHCTLENNKENTRAVSTTEHKQKHTPKGESVNKLKQKSCLLLHRFLATSQSIIPPIYAVTLKRTAFHTHKQYSPDM